jgi:hypothetical protein
MDAVKIVLNRRVTLTADNRHRIQMWVAETSNNIPPHIFVYQRIPVVPLDQEPSSLFVHMASYADLADFPEGEPNGDSPFFRKYYADLVFDALPYMNTTWERICRMVRLLVEDICRLNRMPPAEVVVVDV